MCVRGDVRNDNGRGGRGDMSVARCCMYRFRDRSRSYIIPGWLWGVVFYWAGGCSCMELENLLRTWNVCCCSCTFRFLFTVSVSLSLSIFLPFSFSLCLSLRVYLCRFSFCTAQKACDCKQVIVVGKDHALRRVDTSSTSFSLPSMSMRICSSVIWNALSNSLQECW